MKPLVMISVAVLIGLSGCSSRIDAVNDSMKQIQAEPPLPVPPPPVFLPVPTFGYAAQQMRSPFMPPSLAQELVVMAGRRVMPDLARPPQYLEQFSLEELRMRGTIQSPKAPLFALIESPDGNVMRVQVGNYMGKNFGRVVGITPSQVNVIEIVPDGRDGFVERPRSLVMIDVGT
jgi:type IV pilus assembly protein PilP